ncbi:glycine-rich domain-containing protein [Flavitalea flava]
MVPEQHLSLWEKIQNFRFDDEKATITFSKKLAAKQNWTSSFTKRAIDEYRKFILLCCISENGAAPSHAVDEVWHLHLTYTRSYWIDFCRDALGKEIHHFPSAGGDQEDYKHREWYDETLNLYYSIFGTYPPADIWPPAKRHSRKAPEKLKLVPKTIPVRLSFTGIAAICLLASIPFLFIWLVYNTPFPFSLDGPEFLRFFPLYGVFLFLAYILFCYLVNKRNQKITLAHFPEEASPYQLANALYGRDRAVQVGIVDLIERDLLALDEEDNRFVVKAYHYKPMPGETNPLITAFAAEADGSRHSYEDISANWYDRKNFAHPSLEALNQIARHREPYLRTYLFFIPFYGMAIVRIIQGISNNRPVGLLIGEMIILFFLYLLVWTRLADRWFVSNKFQDLINGRLRNQAGEEGRIVPQFALQGLAAMDGLPAGLLLAGVFTTVTPVNHRLLSKGWWGGDSGGGNGYNISCGGSSCGSSSCGGGGCGGCGGGD